jgi:hypothetical protein
MEVLRVSMGGGGGKCLDSLTALGVVEVRDVS